MNLLWNGFVSGLSYCAVCFLWGHLELISNPGDRSPLFIQRADSSGEAATQAPSLPLQSILCIPPAFPDGTSTLSWRDHFQWGEDSWVWSAAFRWGCRGRQRVCWRLLAAWGQVPARVQCFVSGSFSFSLSERGMKRVSQMWAGRARRRLSAHSQTGVTKEQIHSAFLLHPFPCMSHLVVWGILFPWKKHEFGRCDLSSWLLS